jgi:regulator of nucleoside diphosphate kinase
MEVRILVTQPDMLKLGHLLEQERRWPGLDREPVQTLRRKLNHAGVVREEEIPSDVVTLHSRVLVRHLDGGPDTNYTLVMPPHASATESAVSVLSPIGAALFGRRKGDEIEYGVPGRVQRLAVQKVPYQPEAAARVSARSGATEAP